MLHEHTTYAVLASMIFSPTAYRDGVHKSSESICVEARPMNDYDVAPRLMISEQDARAMLARLDYRSSSTSTYPALSVTDITDASEVEDTDASEVEDAATLVAELRRLTGLTWAQISYMFGVSKRAPFHWASGKNVSSEHHQRLGKIVSLVRYFDRGSAEENKKRLLAQARDGHTFLDLLSIGQDNDFRELVGKGSGRKLLPGSLTPTANKLQASQHWGANANRFQTSEFVEVPIEKSNLRKAKPRRKKV